MVFAKTALIKEHPMYHYHHLTLLERVKIMFFRAQGKNLSAIAKLQGLPVKTIIPDCGKAFARHAEITLAPQVPFCFLILDHQISLESPINSYNSIEYQVSSRSSLHCIVIDVTLFIAATRMILEGKVSVAFACDTVIRRSSIGSRSTSSVLLLNSGNSSRKSTP